MAKREMKSEIKSYNLLKKENYSILPKFMKGFELGNHYYILREGGVIPIIEEERKRHIPKWEEDSVSSEEYNTFVRELYHIAHNYGVFDDIIQPAIRNNGSLLLADLGHFIPLEKVYMYFPTENIDFQRLDSYRLLRVWLEHLDTQIGIKHKVPDFAIDFHIDYYKKDVQNRKFLKDIPMSSLRVWEKIKKEAEV
nr:MAG: hypothetical protein [uncultured archaeon]